MSIKSKIAAIAAASIGMVLTQSSSPRAEIEDNSAPEKVTKIAADLDEEVLYSALPDEVLERAAASSGRPHTGGDCSAACHTAVSCPTYVAGGCITQPVKRLTVPPKGSTGPTVAPKPTQGIKNK